jgi:hypothetical protein
MVDAGQRPIADTNATVPVGGRNPAEPRPSGTAWSPPFTEENPDDVGLGTVAEAPRSVIMAGQGAPPQGWPRVLIGIHLR